MTTFRAKGSGVTIEAELVEARPSGYIVRLAPCVGSNSLLTEQWDMVPELPTEDGWYEAEDYPIRDGNGHPYRLKNGRWMCRECEIYPARMMSLMPLHRLGRDTRGF